MKQTKADTEKEKIFSVTKRGKELINDPLLNKGTCFTLQERIQLGLTGLLPPRVFSLDQQLMRLREN